MATEQGTLQAREVGELMASTATMLDESILATSSRSRPPTRWTARSSRSARPRPLAAEQTQWSATAERLDALVEELESALQDDGGQSSP